MSGSCFRSIVRETYRESTVETLEFIYSRDDDGAKG